MSLDVHTATRVDVKLLNKVSRDGSINTDSLEKHRNVSVEVERNPSGEKQDNSCSYMGTGSVHGSNPALGKSSQHTLSENIA